MANFQLDISLLKSTISKFNTLIGDMNKQAKGFAQTGTSLTISGWTGASSQKYTFNIGRWQDDYPTLQGNQKSFLTTIQKAYNQAEVIAKQAHKIASLFNGASTPTKIGLNAPAADNALIGCNKVKGTLASDLSDLSKVSSIFANLQYAHLSTGPISSARNAAEEARTLFARIYNELNTYEDDISTLEGIMASWSANALTVWAPFFIQYFTHAGMSADEALKLWNDPNAANVLLAVMLGVKYQCNYGGDPVNMATGNFVYQREYLDVKGYFPFSFLMTYNSQETREGALGPGWIHSFEVSAQKQDKQVTLILEDGQRVIFEPDKDGVYRHSQGEDATLVEKDGTFTYRTHAGVIYLFDEAGKLTQITDRNDHFLKFLYDEAGQLEAVANDSGAQFNFGYANGRLARVTDDTGRTLSFVYNKGLLASVTDEVNNTYDYTYNGADKITQVTNPLDIVAVTNEYDEHGRVIVQTLADKGKLTYDFDDDAKTVKLTEQNGNEVAHIHDERYRSVKTVYSDGTETSVYDERNHLISFTDKLGNKVTYSYDEQGNRTGFTNALGEVITTSYSELNRPIEVIVCGIPQLKALYDSRGNALELSDALDRTTKAKRDEAGLPVVVTLPDGSKIELTYDQKGNPLSFTDPSGTSTFEYDERSQPIAAIDPLGNKTTLAYNTKGDPLKITNAAGDNRNYEYNALGRPTKVTDFDGSSIEFGYHVAGKPDTYTDQEGNVTTLEYDLMGNPIKRTDAEGYSTRTEYDQFNRPVKVIDEAGIIVEQYEYDVLGNRTKITGPRGEETRITYDALSRPVEVTEADGAKLSAIYNVLGLPVCITDAAGHKYLRDYDAAGPLITTTDPAGAIYTFSYTLLGKLASVVDPSGLKTVYDYLPGGLLKKVTYPDGRYQIFTYDAAKNLISRTDQDGYVLSYSYDCLGRITEISTSTGQKSTYSYDAVGRVISAIDAQDNTTHYAWSPTGRLISVTDPLGTRTEYTYDKRGLIASVTQLSDLFEAQKLNEQNSELRLTTYKRTPQGRISEITDALGATEAYIYNEAGQPVTKLDKDSYLTNFDYDIVGQLARVDYADGKSVAFTHNALRQLTQIKDWIGTTIIDVDEVGRATKVTDPSGKEVSYRFGPSGERTSVTYPDGREVAYCYDEALRLASLDDGETHIDYGYDQASRLISKLFNNGTAANYSYNETGLLAELVHTDSQGVLDSYAYSYDNLLHKTSIEVFRRGMPEASGSYAYSYDALSRLTEVSKDGKMQKTFGYDPFGNRSFMAEPSGRTNYSYNALNQLLHLESSEAVRDFTYDKRGNLIQALAADTVTHNYGYGPLGRLTSATDATGAVASYLYNGLGQRTGQQIEDGLNPTKRIDYLLDLTQQYNNVLQIDDGTSTKDYLWDTMIAAEVSATGTSTYLPDDLGSPLRFMGADGLLLDSYLYDEFGADLSANQGASQPFGYTGYSFDGVAGTYFAQARQYDPVSGRFAAADPHWNTLSMIYGDNNLSLLDPEAIVQSGNLYAYCMSNPLQFVDVLGEYGNDVHHDDTYQWILNVIKPTTAPATPALQSIAASVAFADQEIDDPIQGTSAMPVIGKPYLHFNTTKTYLQGSDTRIIAAGKDYKDFLTQDFSGIEQQRTVTINKVSPYSIHQNVTTVNAEYDAKLYASIGQGLHSIQDIFAHGNKGIAGVDTDSKPVLPNEASLFTWLLQDSTLAQLSITSHIFNSTPKEFDYTNYDWSDCTLTHVKKVGTANSARFKSTRLASEGYIATSFYEAGKPQGK